jgi:hypothetical protein
MTPSILLSSKNLTFLYHYLQPLIPLVPQISPQCGSGRRTFYQVELPLPLQELNRAKNLARKRY